MRPAQIAGVLLLVLGILAVVYGGFWYTKSETKAEIGPIELKVQEKERVNVPLWAGIGGIVLGAVLLVSGRSRS